MKPKILNMLEHSRQINLPLSYILLKQGHIAAVQAVLGLTLELELVILLSPPPKQLLQAYNARHSRKASSAQ